MRGPDNRPSRPFRPDPKPAPRIVSDKAGRRKVMAEGRCRLCGYAAELSRHHLVPKGQQGDDVDDNIVPLCGSGTTGCHGDVEHWTSGARSKLRGRLTPAELSYIERKKGVAWLDKRYPRPV